MNNTLSICIPVYNCAEFLGQALDSILPQTVGEGIEVIVYDGGSTDHTAALMQRYVSAAPNLNYYRGIHRGGIDADMAKCAAFAHGEYLWLFSGDDVMRPGAIGRALVWIREGHDIYVCEHTLCNKQMVQLRAYPAFRPNKSTCVDFSKPELRKEWFRRAVTTEAFFSFMSSLVVRREKWHSGTLAEDFNWSCWGHVARLFALAPSGLRVCYIAEVWLDMRGSNDSFADKGVVNRYRIAIDGYNQIADTFLGHGSEEAFHIRRVLRNEFGLNMFLFAKLACQEAPKQESKALLDQLMRKAYSDISAIGVFNQVVYTLCPVWLIQWARRLKHCLEPVKRFRNPD